MKKGMKKETIKLKDFLNDVKPKKQVNKEKQTNGIRYLLIEIRMLLGI